MKSRSVQLASHSTCLPLVNNVYRKSLFKVLYFREPVSILHRKMRQGDLVFKVALPPHRDEPPLGSLIGWNQRWRDGNLDVLARLNVDPNVLHDWNVKLMQHADDHTLTSGWADSVVKGFDVDKQLETVGQAVLGKRHHGPSEMEHFFTIIKVFLCYFLP